MWMFIFGIFALICSSIAFVELYKATREYRNDRPPFFVLGSIFLVAGLFLTWFGPTGNARWSDRLNDNTAYQVLAVVIEEKVSTYAVLKEVNGAILFFSLSTQQAPLEVGAFYKAIKDNKNRDILAPIDAVDQR